MLRRVFTALLAAGTSLRDANSQATAQNGEDAGRQLRKMVLELQAKDISAVPSMQAPRVYGVVMDWPVGSTTATVVALVDGTASLYTTSKFGIIGGQAHEKVRSSVARFLAGAELFHARSKPTVDFPYPVSNKVRFYLKCYDGTRVLEDDLESVQSGTSTLSTLFNAGQEVLSELRKTVVK